MTFTRRRLITLFIAMATFVAVLAPTSAQATHDYGYKAKRELTVMSRNLYLGASLAPVTDGVLPFEQAVPQILGEFFATDHEARLAAVADEILRDEPDLVGLQEVALWAFPAPGPTYDFLAILLDELGDAYTVGEVSLNATIPIPGVVTFQDRDVILVRDTEGLKITGSDFGNYLEQFSLLTPLGELSFNRGWAYVDGKYQGRKFRFINTHLETEDFADVQEKQAAEFLRGPARKRGTVIAVGDFNSAADGSTTDTYQMLTKRWQFRDAWRGKSRNQGLTCCFDSALADSSSELSSRIDLVLVKGWAWARPASVIGDQPFQDGAPYWASDHAGVVATIRLF